MYNRFIETNADAYWKHQSNLKKAASDRLRKNAEWNRKNKGKGE